jgi:MFS family permease
MTATASPRIRPVQRSSLALLVVCTALNYVDRSTLAVANPLIRKDLGLSISDMGLLLSAFLWAYAAFQLPAGALVDRFGPRRMPGLGVFVWSLAQALGGLVGGLWQFTGARIFLGLGESPQFTAIVRVVRDWYNVRERGLPTCIALCGSKLGPAIARHCTASLGSIQNCGGYIGGALAPMINSFIVQETGSLVPALLFSAGLGLICGLIYLFMVPNKLIDVTAFGTKPAIA